MYLCCHLSHHLCIHVNPRDKERGVTFKEVLKWQSAYICDIYFYGTVLLTPQACGTQGSFHRQGLSGGWDPCTQAIGNFAFFLHPSITSIRNKSTEVIICKCGCGGGGALGVRAPALLFLLALFDPLLKNPGSALALIPIFLVFRLTYFSRADSPRNISVNNKNHEPNIVLLILNIKLQNMVWELHNMELLLRNSDLSYSRFIFTQDAGGNVPRLVQIFNSTFGQLTVGKQYKLELDNVFVRAISNMQHPIIELNDCTAIIRNSDFPLKAAIFIKATESNIFIQPAVKFFDNSETEGVFKIGNHSRLIMDEAHFFRNNVSQSVIVAENSSAVKVNKCIFEYNTPKNGSVIHAIDNSTVAATKSTFIGNKGHSGGAISAEFNSNLSIHDCLFENNTATSYGGAISLTNSFIYPEKYFCRS